MVAVLYTSNDVAIPAPIGALLVVCVNAIRGIKKPLSVDETSSIADALGAAPVALMPTFCACATVKKTVNNSKNRNLGCMNLIIDRIL